MTEDRRQVGWLNTRTSALLPRKLGLEPSPWWAPVYVDAEEYAVAIAALSQRERRAQGEGRGIIDAEVFERESLDLEPRDE